MNIPTSGGSLFGCGTVTNCHFDGNLLNGYTGAKAIRNRCGIVRDCTFERCVGRDSYADADWAGNGVLIQHGKIALTENCIFTNNGVNAGGTAWGQVYIHDGIFRNCQISDNSITATLPSRQQSRTHPRRSDRELHDRQKPRHGPVNPSRRLVHWRHRAELPDG